MEKEYTDSLVYLGFSDLSLCRRPLTVNSGSKRQQALIRETSDWARFNVKNRDVGNRERPLKVGEI